MANTEGMPDEFVESLATVGSGITSASVRRQEEQRQRARHREKQRQRRLQQRMDLPVGGTPAAKVIRASPNDPLKNAAAVSAPEPVDGSSEMALPTSGIPLVGNIVEHKPNHGNHRINRKGKKVSLFASRNRQPEGSATTAGGNEKKEFRHKHVAGFPSVHNVPLGTFVKPKKKVPQRNTHQATNIITTKPETIHTASSDILGVGSDSHSRMKEASQKESEAMLANMSLEEIRDQQQQIEQGLSPDLLAFLKNRRKQTNEKGKQNVPARATDATSTDIDSVGVTATTNPTAVTATDTLTTATVSGNNPADGPRRQENKAEREEKERMAKLVASIQTQEDLDAAYRAEMKRDVFGVAFEDESSNDKDDINGKEKEQFLVACDLLRSSSPRQTLWAAKTVSRNLKGVVTTKTSADDEEEKVDPSVQPISVNELPPVLSVSLRCLLDKPLNSSCNYILHTYALKSLYYLTVIYAHPDHDMIDDTSTALTFTSVSIFQEDFMDDAVPTPPLDTAYPPMTVRPLEADTNAGPKDSESSPTNPPAAYATSSSTTSAITDGEDFRKDPMWTLLSKMKILPRLAFLLEHQQHVLDMPVEALVAICGILGMVGQRSPGAASAIAQHKTLTSMLLKRMLEQIQLGRNDKQADHKGNIGGDRIVYATMRLFCILSRQSRVAAERLPLEDILPPIIAPGIASSDEQFRTQQQALFLWRTMLRYGYGLEALTTMLAESARHFALPSSTKFSLSSDFLSSFALVLECVKVVRNKNADGNLIAAVLKAGDAKTDTRINLATIEISEMATKMMGSMLEFILNKTLKQTNESHADDPNNNVQWTLRCRWNASRLNFLSAWFQVFDPTIDSIADSTVEDFISPNDQEALVLALKTWTEPSGDVERAWSLVARLCDPSRDIARLSVEERTSIKSEAAACAFINAYFSLALVFLRSKAPNHRIEVAKRDLHEKIVNMTMGSLTSALNTSVPESTSIPYYTDSQSSIRPSRERWINQCHFSVAKFCFHSMSMGLIGSSSDLTMMRSIVFPLLGRLQDGDESMAAVLFSSDALFQTCGSPVQNEGLHSDKLSSSSPISSMFLGEICGSEAARVQLDHSFKLHHGFGITSAGFGPFALDSLLSSAEKGPSATKDSPDDQTLPLGKLWLWRCLSGSIKMRDNVIAVGTEEAADVIGAVLNLILELDETEEVIDIAGYTGRLPMGSKLYFLMNVCLHHEQVLRDERILSAGEEIVDRYLKHFGDNDNDIIDFCQECLDHSGHCAKKDKIADGDEEGGVLEEKDQKLLDDFTNALTINLEDSSISSEQIRALVAFLEDLTTAFRDYGAQYDFFTKCMRVFLLPMFPSLIRCRGLKELENMVHLLTLSKEAEDENEMTKLLSKSLVGGLPSVDNTLRDSTDVLNAVAKTVAAVSSPRGLDGYMRHFCVGMLARNFAISLSTKQGIELSTKRLKRLSAMNVTQICKATESFMQTGDGTKSSLVKAVIDSSHYDLSDDEQQASDEKEFVSQFLDSFVAANS